MPAPSWTRLGPYEIVAPLGAGGMGEVFRARDTRLSREVALKILPESFAHDAARRARFKQEARAASALNHPNIITVYDIGEEGDVSYIVSELVEGESLRALIDRGPVPARKLIDIGAQIADGLAAAHAAGVTHRDLKPENIMLTRAGRVKILDFGIAKVQNPLPQQATVTVPLGTDPGTILGTVSYMSPEQARGEAADSRSDQFSLGLILHEMATGKQTFERPSVPETMTAIIREDAPALHASLPAPLRWVIERLLEKDPENRYAATKDLARDLSMMRDRLSQASASVALTAASAVPVRRKALWPYGLAACVAVAIGVALAPVLIPPPQTDLSPYRFTPLAREETPKNLAQWSPDGKIVAYQVLIHGVYQIFTKAVRAGNATQQLTHASQNCIAPFWSPDGLTIYYQSGGSLWATPASGGTPEVVVKNAALAAVHPDGKTFAIVQGGRLRLGPLDQGRQFDYSRAPFPTQARFRDFKFSPDGSSLAVSLASGSGQEGELWILPVRAGSPRRIARGSYSSVSWFTDNRRLLLTRALGTRNSPVELDTATGAERTIWSSPEYYGSASVAPDGKRIAFTTGSNLWDLVEVSLPGGGLSNMTSRGGLSMFPDWAPSGTHYLDATDYSGPAAIEDRSVQEGFARELISLGSETIPRAAVTIGEPRWAPDGRRFVFGIGFGNDFNGRQIWLSSVSGSRPSPIDPAADGSTAACWSPDGEWIAYIRTSEAKRQLVKTRAPGGGTPIVLAEAAPGQRSQTHWSPAGDWILYPSAAGLSLVSPDGKSRRTLTSHRFMAYGFSKSGDQVIGISRNIAPDQPDWELMSVDMKTGSEKRLAVLHLPPSVGDAAGFSLHPDGKRFATSIARWPYDIWIIEGFDQQKSWLDRLLRR
jgi:serine/threonine protein kinase/Tol biopolymer transport system component